MDLLIRECIRFILLEKHYSDTPSRMIAAFPNEESIKNIIKFRKSLDKNSNVERILEPNELHCTIRWWSVEDEDKTEDVIKFLSKQSFDQIVGKITKLQTLGDSLVLMLDSDELHDCFDTIDSGIKDIGCPPSYYPSYKPHVSLWISDVVPKHKFPSFEIVFDKIALVDGGDKIYWSSKGDSDFNK